MHMPVLRGCQNGSPQKSRKFQLNGDGRKKRERPNASSAQRKKAYADPSDYVIM